LEIGHGRLERVWLVSVVVVKLVVKVERVELLRWGSPGLVSLLAGVKKKTQGYHTMVWMR
jgi:hypothetical protein